MRLKCQDTQEGMAQLQGRKRLWCYFPVCAAQQGIPGVLGWTDLIAESLLAEVQEAAQMHLGQGIMP